MKPIDEVSTGGMEIRLEIPHRIPAIREKQYGLILLHPLRLQQLPQSASRFGVIGLYKAKSFCRRNILCFVTPKGHDALPGNDFEEPRFPPSTDKPAINADRHRSIR